MEGLSNGITSMARLKCMTKTESIKENSIPIRVNKPSQPKPDRNIEK